eukprot:198452-Hanusia_phi.AAC.1
MAQGISGGSKRWGGGREEDPTVTCAHLNSVLPTPVGPRKRAEQDGSRTGEIPTLDRRIAVLTASTASSCPTTRFWISDLSSSRRLLSVFPSLATGIPVQRETMERTSSGPTTSPEKMGSVPALEEEGRRTSVRQRDRAGNAAPAPRCSASSAQSAASGRAASSS